MPGGSVQGGLNRLGSIGFPIQKIIQLSLLSHKPSLLEIEFWWSYPREAPLEPEESHPKV